MKTFLKYICITATVTLLAACSKDELHIPGRTESIEFVMRPTSFNGLDVSTVSTKALLEEEVTEIEAAIYSRYYMIFDKDGNIVQGRTALGIDETSMVLTPNRGTGPFRVCFFANIPTSYLSSISKYSDLATKRLDFEYADHEESGYIGIPVIDGNMCFPMYGEALFPSEDVTPVNNKVIVPLERLFAKVVLNMKAYFDASIGDLLLDSPNLTIFSYSINNLPNSVLLVPPTETPWADSKSDSYFNNYDIDINDITIDNSNILYDEFTTLPKYSTIYVPEYIIKPIEGAENATDQRLKPTLIDEDKRPVYLSMQAKAHQSNFVDVPLEYKIYLGGNAVNDFSLLRNTRYNNYMTITGTGEAIMGTDHRVEATYFNLANPDNTGADDPANCYIISKPGRYLIPTYIGNNVSGGTQIGGYSVDTPIHLSGNTDSDKISNIRFLPANDKENTLGQDCIMFDLNMYDANNTLSLTDVVGSNKLICLKNSAGQIIWSWHLWLCNNGNRPDTESYLNTYPSTGAVVMNRALGATSHQGIEALGYSLAYWDDGLYYQWGRKDPLLPTGNPTASSATYSKAKQNPRTFYTDWKGTYTTENSTDAIGWTSNKSINDPCPPGYKVPSTQIWRSSENSSTGFEDIMENIGLDGYPYNLQTTGGLSGNIVYPYSSYLDLSGSKKIHNPVPLKDSNGNTTLYSSVRNLNVIIATYNIRVQYSGTSTILPLRLWGSTCSLYYDKEEFTIDDTTLIVQYKRSNQSSYNSVNLSGISQIPIIGQSLMNLVTNMLGELKAAKVNYKIDNPIPDNILAYGAHVRCVREDSPVQ